MKISPLSFLKFMPLIFGLGFMAPLIGQALIALGYASIGPLPSLLVGLIIGGVWGGIATKTGRWI